MDVTEEHRGTNGRVKVQPLAIYILIALLGWAAAAVGAYYRGAADQATQTADLRARVMVLEYEFGQLRSDVTEIKNDVKVLIRR